MNTENHNKYYKLFNKEAKEKFAKLAEDKASLTKQIEQATKLEVRSVVLSHLQRGGAPCAYDRRMGRYFGIAAVDLVVQGKYGTMVCVHNGKISHCSLEKIHGKLNLVDVASRYDTDRYNGRRTIF